MSQEDDLNDFFLFATFENLSLGKAQNVYTPQK